MAEPTPDEVVNAASAEFKAQMIRAAAEAFVDLMAEQLIENKHFEDRLDAYREVAIQATFNANVIFEALPDGMKQIFADALRAQSG